MFREEAAFSISVYQTYNDTNLRKRATNFAQEAQTEISTEDLRTREFFFF